MVELIAHCRGKAQAGSRGRGLGRGWTGRHSARHAQQPDANPARLPGGGRGHHPQAALEGPAREGAWLTVSCIVSKVEFG